MTDFANLGVKVDTSSVVKASTDLNKFSAAAGGAETAATTLSNSVQGLNSADKLLANSMARTDTEFQKQVNNWLGLSNAHERYSRGIIMTSAEVKAAVKQNAEIEKLLSVSMARTDTEMQKRINRMTGITTAHERYSQSTLLSFASEEKARKSMAAAAAAEAAQLEKDARAAMFATNSFNKLSMARNKSIQPSAEGVGLSTPFGAPLPRDMMPNRFNTANIAAQFQDIGVTAAMGMNPMTIALQQGTQLSAIINSMENPLKGIAQAFTSIINPISLFSIAVVGLIAALIQMVDWAKAAEGAMDILADSMEYLVPVIAGVAVGLAVLYAPAILGGLAAVGTAILALGNISLVAGAKMASAWVMANPLTFLAGLAAVATGVILWAATVFEPVRTAVNYAINLFVGLFKSIETIFSTEHVSKIFVGVFSGVFNTLKGIVQKMINDVFITPFNYMINQIPEKFRMGMSQIESFSINTDPFATMTEGAVDLGNAVKNSFDFSVDRVGQLQQATSKAADWLRSLTFGDAEDAKKTSNKRDPWAELVKGANARIASFNAEAAAVGLSAEAALNLKYQTDLLNEAMQNNIKLTPEQHEKILDLAAGMAAAETNANKLKDSFNFAKDAGKTFFSELKQGIMEGQSLFETFGNAVTAVLEKVLDKLMEIGVDQLFSGMSGAPASSTAGSIWSSISGMFGFAKGGAFTNGVYNRPTPFTFASGGSFGVMGEAGPEAVMPLHRGSDGSLGVKMSGGGSGSGGVIVNINNNSSATANVQQRKTSQGIEIDVMIDELVAQKLGDQSSTTNRALNSINSRQLIRR